MITRCACLKKACHTVCRFSRQPRSCSPSLLASRHHFRGNLMRTFSLALASLLVASLFAVSTATTAAAGSAMSQTRAGNYYLRHACTANRAESRFYRVMFRGERRVTAEEMKGERLRRTNRPAARLQISYSGSPVHSTILPQLGQANVNRPVGRLAAQNLHLTVIYHDVSAPRILVFCPALTNRSMRICSLAQNLRARLDLPDGGRGC